MIHLARRPLFATLAAALLSTSAIVSLAAGEARIGAILHNPPSPGSNAYSELFAAAGRPSGEALAMTKSEKWDVPTDRWGEFEVAARRLGISISRLDDTWNHALTPMQHGAPATPKQTQMMHDAMEAKGAAAMTMMALPPPAIEEYALTKGMNDASPAAEQPTLMLPLPDGSMLSARRTSIAKTATGYAWHGVVVNTGEPVTVLWWPSGKMTGSLIHRGRPHVIRDLGGGMHAIIQMNPAALPPEHAPMPEKMRAKMPDDARGKTDPLVSTGDATMAMPEKAGSKASPPPDLRNQQDAAPVELAPPPPVVAPMSIVPPATVSPAEPVVIRMLVAYTKAAAQHYADIETDLIALAIEDANQSFRSSGLGNVTLEVAHTYQTDYVERGSHFEHVFGFADSGDGKMDEAHALRDKFRADVGLLIVDDANGCGLAAEVYARPERAFAVIHHGCASTMYSLPHEIGHLIGARHDEALDDSTRPFSFGHGFVHGKSWRTMMSYKDSCDGCPRLPIWSSPAVRVGADPAGDAESDNARVIAQNAARVAGFR